MRWCHSSSNLLMFYSIFRAGSFLSTIISLLPPAVSSHSRYLSSTRPPLLHFILHWKPSTRISCLSLSPIHWGTWIRATNLFQFCRPYFASISSGRLCARSAVIFRLFWQLNQLIARIWDRTCWKHWPPRKIFCCRRLFFQSWRRIYEGWKLRGRHRRYCLRRKTLL